ncbi:histidine ammonia-lyase [Poseidonibacter lekithochrous]|uniref:histidine ammonia-lyase n=1 Tax=Poseidonibacter lekithochrous TaxID=1904463 RepID=UPI0008FC68C7|nr:histidine ammonia-lyase [Poseidonibacter lekithochrous]QKJ23251.1 histidase [Poseidonibacter lekithochrous]
MFNLHIIPGQLTLQDLRRVNNEQTFITLDSSAKDKIKKANETILNIVDEDRTVYGVNTGFGLLANTKIAKEDLEDLQRRIVLSHSAGMGEYISNETVRLMITLKINSLSLGYSGIRLEVIEALISLVNNEVYPCVPKKGSVGASGDLAPLAHMSAILLGYGYVNYKGEILKARDGLKKAGMEPIVLGAKEGLALLNGTQLSTTFSLEGLFLAEDLFASAIVAGSMCVEAVLGSRAPFDDRVHTIRGHKGQIDTAKMYRDLLEDESEISQSHKDCTRVQDPYSIRCQPQVMGACLTQIRNSAETLLIESNGVTDNPLIFVDEQDVISGGNFHAEPIAFASDNLALAISEIGALSERRMALLVDKHLSQLPAFLVNNGGINSGFMIAQVTSAALASENKALAHPSSVDSLPTSANQEDHVSMATYAGRRLKDMAENTAGILGIELLATAQGMDFRAPNKSTSKIEETKKILREKVSFYEEDRYFTDDIEEAISIVQSGIYNKYIDKDLIPSF